MERDFAYRFTNEVYATKEVVKKTLNINSIDHIWDTILAYRKLYNKVLDLFSNDKKPFTVCLCEGILKRYIDLEKKIMDITVLNAKYQNNQILNSKTILRIITQIYDFKDVSDTIINGIVENTIAQIPYHYQIFNKYYSCLKDIEICYASLLNENTIKRLFSILMHGEINKIDEINKLYRVTELESNFDPYENFRHYEGSPTKNIPYLMEILFDDINENKLVSLIEGGVLLFYILYFKPFEIYNEEMAILLTKYYLKNHNENLLYLPLEELILDLNSDEMKKVFLECEKSLDLTYFIDMFFTKLDKFLQEQQKNLKHQQELEMQNEILVEDDINNLDNTSQTFLDDNNLVNQDTKVEMSRFEGVTFERKVSMPIIPKGLDEKDASLVAENLIEICPTLKKGQAEFYARHCTIGKYYTIQQYKIANKVAYETARTSMDNLADLGFYKKEKIRNKFVYTPIIRS